jgi:protein-disulfide isomerase
MKLIFAAIGLTLCAGLAAARTEFVEGNPASTVKVVIYSDLQCPDCLRLRLMLDEKILPKYGKRVAFVHRDFPLGKHDWARQGAIAARWVDEQNPELGMVFRREIMSEQEHITAATLKPWLREFAVRNKLDPNGITAAVSDRRLDSLVDQDLQGALARGVTSAPTIIIGNQRFSDTILYEDIAKALDIELGR